MNVAVRLTPHHTDIFVTTRDAGKTTMRLAPHLAYSLITSRRRGNFRVTARSDAACTASYALKQVVLTPQCKWHQWQLPPDTPEKVQHVVSPSIIILLHSSAINTNPKPGLRSV
uniref:Uncharacterized protein n=1 Tax=Helianthus annuus TaxID=4232 RepID=A0A251SAV0_HELAN